MKIKATSASVGVRAGAAAVASAAVPSVAADAGWYSSRRRLAAFVASGPVDGCCCMGCGDSDDCGGCGGCDGCCGRGSDSGVFPEADRTLEAEGTALAAVARNDEGL